MNASPRPVTTACASLNCTTRGSTAPEFPLPTGDAAKRLGLSLIEHGYEVLLYRPTWNSEKGKFDKRPIGGGADHATRSADELLRRFQQSPDVAVGIRRGHGVAIVDDDGYKLADTPARTREARRALAVHDLVFGVPNFATASGGRHWYFSALNLRGRKCTVPGFELLENNGFIAVAGELPPIIELQPLPEKLVVAFTGPLSLPVTLSATQSVVTLEGGRNTFLTSEAGKLQRIGFDPAALRAAIHGLNCARCQPPLPGGEVDRIVDSVGRYPPHHEAPTDSRNITLLRATDMQPEAIAWLWGGWLARGKLQILAGAPGCGKTTIALKFAATLTTGGLWPDQSRAPVGNVLIWSGEDDPRDTLLPRLLAMGADRTRIYFVDGAIANSGESRPFDPARDMALLCAEAQRIGDVAFMIVDPIVNAVAGDSHKNSETRRSLQPVVELAEQMRAAVLGISHYTKGTQGRDPIERVTGSIAFGAVPRIIMGAAKVQRDEGRTDRILVRAKSNIGPDGGGYEYTLEQVELQDFSGLFASAVQWGLPVDGSAQNLLAEAEGAADPVAGWSLGEAKDFLRSELTGGPVPSKELEKRACAAGISKSTMKRARAALGVRARKDGPSGAWSMVLPVHLPMADQGGQLSQLPQHGPVGLVDTSHIQEDQEGQEDHCYGADPLVGKRGGDG